MSSDGPRNPGVREAARDPGRGRRTRPAILVRRVMQDDAKQAEKASRLIESLTARIPVLGRRSRSPS